MTEENGLSNGSHLTKGRLEALSDGIFAFAMTLLVIGLSVPDKATLVPTNTYALHVLLALYSSFIHYVLAFLILGAFWLSQHMQFHSVRTPDKLFTWINLVTLMFVALLPFSASFSGAFSNVPVGAMVFESNLLLIGLGMSLQWWYATNRPPADRINAETGVHQESPFPEPRCSCGLHRGHHVRTGGEHLEYSDLYDAPRCLLQRGAHLRVTSGNRERWTRISTENVRICTGGFPGKNCLDSAMLVKHVSRVMWQGGARPVTPAKPEVNDSSP